MMDDRNKTLDEMQAEVLDNNVKHGWFDRARSVGDDAALIHSEVSEMFEAYRKNRIESHPSFDNDNYDPSSMHAEAADIFIRLLDFCERHDVDLELEYEFKMKFNRDRPYKHGNKIV